MKRKLLFFALAIGCCSAFSQSNIVGYQYWFDNDFVGRTTTQIIPSKQYHILDAVSTEGLSTGLHIVNVRTQSNQGDTLLLWSSTVSHYFFKNTSSGGQANPIAAYQYWYDTDFDKAVTQSVEPSQQIVLDDKINASAISTGLHTFHLRIMDNSGLWSSTVSHYFFKNTSSGGQANPIAAYQYWYDTDFDKAVTQSVEPSQQIVIGDKISASAVSTGLHTFNMRIMDNSGLWSSTMSQFFFKTAISGDEQSNQVTACQYWYDNDFANAQEIILKDATVAHLRQQVPANSLTNGLHCLNIRCRDNSGLWSSAISHLFFKRSETSAGTGENLIEAYQYWFNDDFENAVYTELASPAQEVVVEDVIDFRRIPKGTYAMNIRFKDAQGLWSSTITDTIEKVSLPIADFTYEITYQDCDSAAVSFTNNSIDGDIYRWEISDRVDSLRNISQVFYGTGVYNIILTTTDTTLNKDSTIVVPLDLMMKTYSIIDAEAYGSYTAPDNQTYTDSGTYTAIIPNAANCDSVITIHLTILKVDDIKDTERPQIKISPNPAKEHLQIQMENIHFSALPTVIIYDELGRALYRGKIDKDVISIDVSKWSNGVYLIEINDQGTIYVNRLVKE